MNQKEKLSDKIAEQLITLISSEFKEGDKLPTEPELATLFGVSRITIREAVGKLATYGILEVKQGDGTSVIIHEANHSHAEAIECRIDRYLRGKATP